MQKDRFNDVHNMDNHMLINSKQLKYAESFVNQLTKTEVSVLDGLKSLKADHKQTVKHHIHQLSSHTLTTLKQNTVYSSQLTQILHQFQLKMHKLLIVERLFNVKELILMSIHQAVLTHDQSVKAVSEVTSTYQYIRKELLKAQETSVFQSIFTSGINAMNGALAKYVSQSQMCTLNQIQDYANRVKRFINYQSHLSVTAKYIANQNIKSILNESKHELITTTNFNGLRNIKHYCLKKLKQISGDENRSLNNLTTFTNFTDQLTVVVTKLSQLSADTRLQLKSWVVKRQREFITDVQRFNRNITNDNLNTKEYELSVKLVSLVSQGYQREINSQTVNLSDKQRKILVQYINQIASDLTNNLQAKKSIGMLIKKSLWQLNRKITDRENKLVYQNQTQQIVDDFELKINNLYDLSSIDKRNLQAQVITFGQLASKKNLKTLNVDTYLQNWLSKQVEYLSNSGLQKQAYELYNQIKFSHLSSAKRQSLLHRLTNILRNSEKRSYKAQQTLVKDVNDYGLSLDKSVNLHELTDLNGIIDQQVQTYNISSDQGKLLSQEFVNFSQQINGMKSISAIDHLEQTYEDRIYSHLSQPKLDASPLRVQALRFPINQAHEARRKINLSILNHTFRQYINDRINGYLCSYLNSILQTNNEQLVKDQLNQITYKIKEQLSQSLSWIKDNYNKYINFLVLDTYHQLVLYSHSKGTLDHVELINSHISRAISNAGDLLHVEYANQQGQQALDDYTNKIIKPIDHSKATGHQLIGTMVKSLDRQLKDSQINMASNDVKLASRNQILSIANYFNRQINQGLDKDIDYNCRKCQDLLNHVLRQSYRQEWLKVSGQAQLSIQQLIHVPIDPKIQVLRSLQSREIEVENKLQTCNKDHLSEILKNNKLYIQKTVRHGIYLDPVKRQMRNHLDQIVKKIQYNFNHYTSGKVTQNALNRLDTLNSGIDRRVLNSRDRHIKPLYQTEYKMLLKFEIKVIRKAQLQRFNVHIKKIEHQTHQLSLLAGKELDHVDMQFNNCYHETIYKINHVSDIMKCVNNERQGESTFKRIFANGRKINHLKQRLKKSIVSKIKAAHLAIQSLNNLQDKDKKDSFHLLKQIQQQTIQNIKNADGSKQSSQALRKGQSMIKQVIDKVSSAGVLVSAIQTANNQIASSTLDPKQKKATLHQINQIIDNGIKSQFKSPNKFSTGSNPKSNQYQSRKSSRPNFKTLVNQKVRAKEKRKHHHTFFGFSLLVIFVAVGLFFKQCLTILSQIF